MATGTAVLAAFEQIRNAYGPRAGESTKDALKVWHTLLEPLDDAALDAAVLECCRTLEHPPSPANLLNAARSASRPAPPHHDFPDEPERYERPDPSKVADLLEHARKRMGVSRGA